MAISLTRDFLKKLAPRPSDSAKAKIWDGYVDALTSAKGAQLLAKFEINTELRLAHLLAQWLHECAGFTLVWESGAYSAKRIVQIFGVGRHSAKVTAAEASRLAYNGPALFERVYGLGNPGKARELGNTQKGDGWRFRGCGIVQLTGRAAHERYAEEIGCAVEDIEKPINAIHGALLEWREKNCNVPADRDDILSVTKKVNGGTNGLAERRSYLAKAKRLLDVVDLDGELPAEEPVAAPVAAEPVKTPTSALVAVSRKARIAVWLRRVGHAIWGGITLDAILEYFGMAQSTINQVKQFVHDNQMALIITAGILLVIAAKGLLALMAEDVDAGRAIPSGEAA